MTQRSSQHIKHINLCFSFSGTILSFEPEVVNYMRLKFMYHLSVLVCYTAIAYELLASQEVYVFK
jgi:hypothetical protein